MKFILVNTNLWLVSKRLHTYKENKNYICWDVLAENFISNLNLLSFKLQDQKNSIYSFNNVEIRGLQNNYNYRSSLFDIMRSYLRIYKQLLELNSIIYLNNIIILILNDTFIQKTGKKNILIFQRRSTKIIVEQLVKNTYTYIYFYFIDFN